MQYRVTAGHIHIDGPDGTLMAVKCGDLLPSDASQEQVDHELTLGTIEPVLRGEGVDASWSVVAVMRWVGSDAGRAQAALDAETGRESPRATLVSRLEAVLEAAEGDGADSGTGASVDS